MNFSPQFIQTVTLSLLAVVILTTSILVTKKIRGSVRKGKGLHTVYRMALKAGDRERAIRAGRAYYAHMRNGIPSEYDEQVILDDVKGMRV